MAGVGTKFTNEPYSVPTEQPDREKDGPNAGRWGR
jgi:hypothetical protein